MKKTTFLLFVLFFQFSQFSLAQQDSIMPVARKHLTELDSIKKVLDNRLLKKLAQVENGITYREQLEAILEDYEDQWDYAFYDEMQRMRHELGLISRPEKEDGKITWRKVVIKVLENAEKKEEAKPEIIVQVKDSIAKHTKKRKIFSSASYFGWGFNAMQDGSSSGPINESDYLFGKSRFVELGLEFQLFLDKHAYSNLYLGVGFMWNKLVPRGNYYHVVDNGQVKLVQHTEDLSMNKMRTAWLRVPLGLDFRIPLSGHTNLNIGAEAYGKIKLSSVQKLAYNADGAFYKIKEKRDFLQNDFTYGAGAHIGINNIQIYGGMDFAPYFKNQNLRMFYIGIRLK